MALDRSLFHRFQLGAKVQLYETCTPTVYLFLFFVFKQQEAKRGMLVIQKQMYGNIMDQVDEEFNQNVISTFILNYAQRLLDKYASKYKNKTKKRLCFTTNKFIYFCIWNRRVDEKKLEYSK